MAQAVARTRFLRIAPRKLRLLADLIRGKRVWEARDILAFSAKGGALPMSKLLASAVANAESAATERRERIDTDEMIVERVLVDEGRTMYRLRTSMRRRAMRIRKRTSHIEIVISDSASQAAEAAAGGERRG